MTLPRASTIVTYPSGAVTSRGRVLHVEALPDGRTAVILDETACHPVDHTWPDQGADRAILDGVTVEDCIVGATDGTRLYVGRDVPVRKGTDGWAFLVVHIVSTFSAAEGDSVDVVVDPDYRLALSTGHTLCHLASLALNDSLAAAWSKEVPSDAAGHPDFDALAIETSTILENGSRDVYRIGKSLRKKGFDPAALDDIPLLEGHANERLAGLLATGADVRIESDGPRLDDRRRWVFGDYRIPCGGTHLASVAGVTGRIELDRAEADGAIGLVMTTHVA